MARKNRDYAAEYRTSHRQGLSRGLTRAQARGHAHRQAWFWNDRPTIASWNSASEVSAKRRSMTRMARSLGVSSERLRDYAVRSGVVEKQAGRYVAIDDDRLREVTTFSRGREEIVVLRGFKESSKWGRYMAAVGRFLDTNDPTVLLPLEDDVLTDGDGKAWPFEVRPNVLYRLNVSIDDPSVGLYRIARSSTMGGK